MRAAGGDAACIDQEHPAAGGAATASSCSSAARGMALTPYRQDAAAPCAADRSGMSLRRSGNAGISQRGGRSDPRRRGAVLGARCCRCAIANFQKRFRAEGRPRGWGQHRHPSAPVRRRSRYRRVRAARSADAAAGDRGSPFFDLHMRVIAGDGHPLLARRDVKAADLTASPWALYQHDRDIAQKLVASLRDHGGTSPRILVESTSVAAVMELLRAGPYLSCIADAFLRVGRESGVSVGPVSSRNLELPVGRPVPAVAGTVRAAAGADRGDRRAEPAHWSLRGGAHRASAPSRRRRPAP